MTRLPEPIIVVQWCKNRGGESVRPLGAALDLCYVA